MNERRRKEGGRRARLYLYSAVTNLLWRVICRLQKVDASSAPGDIFPGDGFQGGVIVPGVEVRRVLLPRRGRGRRGPVAEGGQAARPSAVRPAAAAPSGASALRVPAEVLPQTRDR